MNFGLFLYDKTLKPIYLYLNLDFTSITKFLIPFFVFCGLDRGEDDIQNSDQLIQTFNRQTYQQKQKKNSDCAICKHDEKRNNSSFKVHDLTIPISHQELLIFG